MPTQTLVLALVAGALWLASVVLLTAAPLRVKQWMSSATRWLDGAMRDTRAGLGTNAGRDGPLALAGAGRSGRWLYTLTHRRDPEPPAPRRSGGVRS